MKKFFFFLLLACSLEARQRYSGICQQGGQYPLTVGYPSSAPFVASFPGCSVAVYQAGTLTFATIYSDNLGTQLANPFPANAIDGSYGWYANDGAYDIQLSGGGLIGVVKIPAVWLLSVTSTGLTALTGDGTATGPGSAPLILATVNGAPGTCGDATHVCQVTTNAKGLVTSQTAVAITATPYTFSPPLVNTSGTISLTRTGTGAVAVSATAAGTSGNCAQWLTGNLVDAGAPCGSGGGSPLTTKGDLYGFSTVNARLPVGTNGFALVADSTQALGIKWAAVTASAAGTNGQFQYNSSGSLDGFSLSSGPISITPSTGTGAIATGPTNALDCVTSSAYCDINQTVVPVKSAANTFTGLNKFNFPQIVPTSTDPGCTTTGNLGLQWIDNTSSVTTHYKICAAVASTPAWVTVF